MLNEHIEGVIVKELKSFPDDRGFFREIIRSTDDFFKDDLATGGFAQWSHSKMGQNTVKAWHFHHLQTDWWYVPFGKVRVALIDNREESPTKGNTLEILCGDDEDTSTECVIRIPPGVLHGCKVLSDTAHLFYITSKIYDPEDEGRVPFNELSYSWLDGDQKEESLIIAPNDRKHHTPKYKRLAKV